MFHPILDEHQVRYHHDQLLQAAARRRILQASTATLVQRQTASRAGSGQGRGALPWPYGTVLLWLWSTRSDGMRRPPDDCHEPQRPIWSAEEHAHLAFVRWLYSSRRIEP